MEGEARARIQASISLLHLYSARQCAQSLVPASLSKRRRRRARERRFRSFSIITRSFSSVLRRAHTFVSLFHYCPRSFTPSVRQSHYAGTRFRRHHSPAKHPFQETRMSAAAPPPPPDPNNWSNSSSPCSSSSMIVAAAKSTPLRRSKTVANPENGAAWRREPLVDITNSVVLTRTRSMTGVTPGEGRLTVSVVALSSTGAQRVAQPLQRVRPCRDITKRASTFYSMARLRLDGIGSRHCHHSHARWKTDAQSTCPKTARRHPGPRSSLAATIKSESSSSTRADIRSALSSSSSSNDSPSANGRNAPSRFAANAIRTTAVVSWFPLFLLLVVVVVAVVVGAFVYRLCHNSRQFDERTLIGYERNCFASCFTTRSTTSSPSSIELELTFELELERQLELKTAAVRLLAFSPVIIACAAAIAITRFCTRSDSKESQRECRCRRHSQLDGGRRRRRGWDWNEAHEK